MLLLVSRIHQSKFLVNCCKLEMNVLTWLRLVDVKRTRAYIRRFAVTDYSLILRQTIFLRHSIEHHGANIFNGYDFI